MNKWLYSLDGGRPFAWTSDDRNYWDVANNGSWWAWRNDKWLYSPSGQLLGCFSGKYFYDVKTSQPQYFLR